MGLFTDRDMLFVDRTVAPEETVHEVFKPSVAIWDFNTALSQTIKEKYENLYVKVIEVSNVINRRTISSAANWVITSPGIEELISEEK